jgi:hypothetical protein
LGGAHIWKGPKVDSLIIAAIVFACTFGGAAFGMVLRTVLPEHHRSDDSKDVMKMGMGLIATISALVLGLLVASAKSSYDAQKSGYQQVAANFVLLDRTLAHYGKEAMPARALLRRTVVTLIDRLWPADGSRVSGLDATEITELGGAVLKAVRELKPQTDVERLLQAQAVQIAGELARLRWSLSQQEDSAIPAPFLVVLVFWLFVLFTSFGLYSPRNATVITVHCVCALSVAGALFLIVDLGQPFQGMFQIPSTPFQKALTQLGQ